MNRVPLQDDELHETPECLKDADESREPKAKTETKRRVKRVKGVRLGQRFTTASPLVGEHTSWEVSQVYAAAIVMWLRFNLAFLRIILTRSRVLYIFFSTLKSRIIYFAIFHRLDGCIIMIVFQLF